MRSLYNGKAFCFTLFGPSDFWRTPEKITKPGIIGASQFQSQPTAVNRRPQVYLLMIHTVPPFPVINLSKKKRTVLSKPQQIITKQKQKRIAYAIRFVLALPIFPGRRQPSIVGRDELNYRVRNGNGWTLILINTNSSFRVTGKLLQL